MATFRCAACGAVNRLVLEHPGAVACERCRRPLDLTGRPQPVDAAALVAAILACPSPVLVDFSAPGAASPALLEQARALAGSLLVLSVDPGAEPAATAAYAVRETPTLVLFADGAEVGRRAGGGAWPDLPSAVAGPRAAPR
jgi:thioredoxin 2